MSKIDEMNEAIKVIVRDGVQSKNVTVQALINLRKAIIAISDAINENITNKK